MVIAISIVLAFHKHYSLPLGQIKAFISRLLPRSPVYASVLKLIGYMGALIVNYLLPKCFKIRGLLQRYRPTIRQFRQIVPNVTISITVVRHIEPNVTINIIVVGHIVPNVTINIIVVGHTVTNVTISIIVVGHIVPNVTIR